MTHLLIDTSVLIKWFHSEGEHDVTAARALRAAHTADHVDVHVLDLGCYELGNVLIRALHWSSAAVGDQLEDLLIILGPPLVMTARGLRLAAELAEAHSLSFYDAAWAATASELGIALVSADRRLVRAGLAESPGQTVERLRLPE